MDIKEWILMLDDFDFDKESPFQPGKPVSPYYFKGRTKIVKKILNSYFWGK